MGGYKQWSWDQILPFCMDMDGSDNFCIYEGYKPDETSRSLMHKSYPFSEIEDGKIVSQFTYKGETYEVSQRRDSEGALIYDNSDNYGNAEGGIPSYSYVDDLNDE